MPASRTQGTAQLRRRSQDGLLMFAGSLYGACGGEPDGGVTRQAGCVIRGV